LSGLSFLFSAALWALPLAALPLLIHLVVRSKTRVVPFSTLRFVRSSLRQTAGRRRVRRWTLLGCRMALLALLIWAVAQPARRLAANWSQNPSVAAAIVVDTSYSMALRDGQTSLLAKADQTVNQLLAQELQNAQIAVFTSRPNPDTEHFQSAEAALTNWKTLTLQPALSPLEDRIAAAAQALSLRTEDQRWLIIVSDLQQREFPAPLPSVPGIRTALIDLHPLRASSAAIVSVQPDPPQPRSGIGTQLVIDVRGRPGESIAANLSATPLGSAQTISSPNLPMAQLDQSGQSTLRVPFTFSGSPWILLTASLQSPDRLPWAASRSDLVNLPPPAIAQVLTLPPGNSQADTIVRLALDPNLGSDPNWPIALHPPGTTQGDEDLLAVNLTQWPDEATADQWTEFTRRGGVLILFAQPGLEQLWQNLPSAQKNAIEKILPGIPVQSQDSGPFLGSIARPDDPVFSNVGPGQSASGNLRLDRIMPIQISDPQVQTIMRGGSWPLLARKNIGTGQLYFWSTLPIPLDGNLPTSEIFLPILVNSSLRNSFQSDALNVEAGHRLILTGHFGSGPLDLYPPRATPYRVTQTDDAQGRRWISEPANDPGIYLWKRAGEIVAYSNVQYPAAEADLDYRSPIQLGQPSPDFLIAHSTPELQARIADLSRPQPRWSGPIALVLLLLCVEMLLGGLSKTRKNLTSRAQTGLVTSGI
jgi:aerotolerance regulator-like protein